MKSFAQTLTIYNPDILIRFLRYCWLEIRYNSSHTIESRALFVEFGRELYVGTVHTNLCLRYS